jgi:hypothetical protein
MGVKAVFGTMFPRKELIGYLDTMMDVSDEAQRFDRQSCTRKDTQNWVLVSDQYNYVPTGRRCDEIA